MRARLLRTGLPVSCGLLWVAWMLWPGQALGESTDGSGLRLWGGLGPEHALADPRLTVVKWGPDYARLLYEVDAVAAAAAVAAAEELAGAGARGVASAVEAVLAPLAEATLVGVPQEGDVRLEILEAREVARLRADVAAHLANGRQRTAPASLGEIGHLREQRVAGIRFGPSQEADGTIAVYDRIVAQVLMEGGVTAPQARAVRSGERFAEALYAAAIANCEQARSWRGRSRGAGRPVQQRESQDELLKIAVRSKGIFRITGEDLEEVGINLQDVQPARLRVLYGGGHILGRSTWVSAGVRREEIPIVVEDGGDGRFDASDCVLFYGEPAERWQLDPGKRRHVFLQNPYTDDNTYWLAVTGEQDGLRAARRSGKPTDPEALRPDRHRERIHQEDNRFVLQQLEGISSGYDWYWENFQGNARNFPFTLSEAVDDPIQVRVQIWGWTVGSHSFDLRWNGRSIGRRTLAGTGPVAITARAVGGATEGENQLGIFHLGTELTRLDWIELEYSRRLVAREGELSFDWADAARAADGTAHRGVATFALSGFAGVTPRVFDVADGLTEIAGSVHDPAAGVLVFQDEYRGSARSPLYVVATPSRWRRPAQISRDVPGHLRAEGNGAEYIIITHGDFRGAAERLGSWRARDDRFGNPLVTAVVDVADIYDEFSGGMLDPMAIRSFVHHAVLHWDPAPFFILLVGDGTYDYRNHSGTSHTNWMPAFQDGISMYDEWYVRIAGNDALPDLAIGRLPVRTAAEADGVVDKLIGYDREPETGPWRVRSLLIADDLLNPQSGRRESSFLIDAELMAHRYLPKDLDPVKLYLAQYRLEGRIKPRARDAFVRRFNEGALLLTYIGHGNPETLAHEQMFVLSRDFAAIDNGRRWPFMYTAASQVGVFDDPTRQSMPEVFVNAPDRGVIGFISATRVGFHASNMILARAFYTRMFRSGEHHVPVGLGLTVAKQVARVLENDAKGRINVQRYSLLGDPAMRLARPVHQVELAMPDTLQALEEVHLEGRVVDASGRYLQDYEGLAQVQVFDSSAGSQLDGLPFMTMGAPIYRGLARVEDGLFRALFRVPKDITYRTWMGRASAYVWQNVRGSSTGDLSAFGTVRGLNYEGTAQIGRLDETGPEITFGFGRRSGFDAGDFVGAEPVLRAVLADESGINIAGDTGHEIILSVDGELSQVTESYVSQNGGYRSGVLERQLGPLGPGVHTIGLKAWDSHNNSSRAETEIRVSEDGPGALSEVIFSPNPMMGDTGYFTYELAETAGDVRIQVYTVAGRLVDELEGTGYAGYNQVEWSASPDLAAGAYLYRIGAVLGSGAKVSSTSVMLMAPATSNGQQ